MRGALATVLCLITYFYALHGHASGTSSKELKQRHKSLAEYIKRQHILRVPGPDIDIDKDDAMDKRQELLFDDYGHMRFGKREESDDYGHLRFGRDGD